MGRNKRDVRPPFVVTLALSGLAACGGATDDRSGGVGGAGGGSSGSSGKSGEAGTGGRGWGGEGDPGTGGTAGVAANGSGGFAAFAGSSTSGSSGSAGNPPAPDAPPDPRFEAWIRAIFDPSLTRAYPDPKASDAPASTPSLSAAEQRTCDSAPADPRYRECASE